jgi:hypothetical protein
MLIALASIILAGCGGKTDVSSPKEIVETVLNASINFDFETLRKHLAKNRLEYLEESEKEFAEDAESRDDFLKVVKDAKIKALSEEISEDGQSATVVVQIKLKSEEEPFEKDIYLVKENDKWKMDGNPY